MKNHFNKMKKEVGMLLQKRVDTRAVRIYISYMRKTPTNHTNRFQEAGVASRWNVWVWLSGGGCGWNLLVWLGVVGIYWCG